MRFQLLFVVLGLVGVGCASKPNAPPKEAWYPIPGASVMPREQSEAVCESILEEAREIVNRGGDASATTRAKSQYRSCMARNGWTNRPVSARDDDGRAAARRKDAEQFNAKLEKSRSKNALTLLVGDAPDCQAGDPGTEICRWRWTRNLPTEKVPLQMTCVLPRDGRPRDEGSCQYSVREAR
jgi:hypothetical protein